MSDEVISKQPTPALDFRQMREQGALITFPSTRAIRVRHTDPSIYLDGLAQTPAIFQELIKRMLVDGDAPALARDFLSTPRTEVADIEDFFVSLNIVCSEAMIAPWIARPTPRESALRGVSETVNNWMLGARNLAAWRAPDRRKMTDQISAEDVYFDDKCYIFLLAFDTEIALYHVAQNGIPVLSDEQVAAMMAEQETAVSENAPVEQPEAA